MRLSPKPEGAHQEARTPLLRHPGTAIALVALFFALGGSAFAVGERIQSPSVAPQRCANGAVRGIATVAGIASGDREFLGQVHERQHSLPAKVNCTGKAVQARRVEAGVFEVKFVGISGASRASAFASAVSDDAYATVRNGTAGSFIVTMHPAGRDDRADVAFTLVAA